MHEPTRLATDHLQSDDFVPHDENGKGGRGWRLCKNGDLQIGETMIRDGTLTHPYGTLRLGEPQKQYELGFDPDKQRYLDEKHLREGGVQPVVFLSQEQIDAAKCDLPPHVLHKPGAGRGVATHCDMEVVVRVDLPEGADPVKSEGYARAIRQIVIDTVNSSEVLQGMRSGRITTEQTVRAESDMALASRISGMDVADGTAWGGIGAGLDLGKEYLYVKQPGGPVAIGDLQKCCGRDTFTEQFLNREVRSDLKPEVASALSMAAPMTGNGKVPINNLPRPVDDDQ